MGKKTFSLRPEWIMWITLGVGIMTFLIVRGAGSSEEWMEGLGATRQLVGAIVAVIGVGAILGSALNSPEQWRSAMVPWVVVLLAGLAVASAHWGAALALGAVVACSMLPAAKSTAAAAKRKAA